MAISTRKQQQPQHFQYTAPQPDTAQPTAAQPTVAQPVAEKSASVPWVAKWGTWKKWPWIAGGMAVVTLWLLPGLVAHSPLMTWAINKAAADLNGTVRVRSASLGWFSPVSAEGIEIRDAKGQPILQANSLQGDKSLLSLLGNLSAIGKMKLEKPKLTLELRADGSNLEDALAKYLAPTDKPSNRVGVELEIVDGTVEVIDQVNKHAWNLEKHELTLTIPLQTDKPIELKTQAVVSDLKKPAPLDLAVLIQPDMSGKCLLNTDALPLAMFDALLGRVAPGASVSGRLSARLDATWSAAGRTDIQGRLSTSDLEIAAPTALGDDRLAFDRMELTCRAAGQNNVYVIEPTTLDCDLGKLTLSGNLDFSRGGASFSEKLLAQDYEVQGSLDLARLAALLPGTLRIREGTQITAGTAEVQLSSRKEAQGMVWHAGIDAANLRGTAKMPGTIKLRDIAWERPISFVLDAHDSAQGVSFDQVKCQSTFLAIQGAGTRDNFEASGSFNLKTLADQLGQFIDLDGYQLAGDGWGRFGWLQSGDGQFETKTEVQVRSFGLSLPQKSPWIEPNLMVIAEGTGSGQLQNLSAARLDQASVNIETASDKIDVSLTQPVAGLGSAKWPVHVEVSGEIEAWLARLGVLMDIKQQDMEKYRGKGKYQAVVECVASAEGVEIGDAKMAVAPLQVACESFAINEPRVEGSLKGAWNQAKRQLNLDTLQLTTSAATLEGRNVGFAMPAPGRSALTGAVYCKADMARVAEWFANPAKPRTWSMGGALSGTLTFQPSAFGLGASLDAEIVNLSVTAAQGKPAVEPRVTIAALGNYNTASGVIEIQKASIASQAIAADMAGNMNFAAEQAQCALKGNLGCDFAALCGLLRPYLGTQIDITGRSSAPMAFEGPMDLISGRGNAAAQWQQANIYGFPLGAAEVRLALADGWLRAEPLTLPVSQGRVTLAPALDTKTSDLYFPKGKLADHIQITRTMCDSALMYIAPVLADVADAKGAFSIELDGARIRLADPAKSDVGGRFIVHDIEVGVSPLVEALLSIVGRVTPGKLRQEAVVPFRMVDGRVYHQNLELIFPELTIRTQGWVAIDQSIELLAEMPIPQKWTDALGKTALADSMRGQTISIPVRGTLKKPQLDQRVLEEFSKKAVRGAAEDMIGNEINKGLDRLLGPRK